MKTIQQGLTALRKCQKVLIRFKKGLLWAAVILFSLLWPLFNPFWTADKLLLSYLKGSSNETTASLTTEQAIPNLPSDLENNLYEHNYFISQTLASIAGDNTEDEDASFEESYGDETKIITLQQGAVLAYGDPITFIRQEPRSKIISYTVKEGDTPSTIAASFGITLNTLLWANNLRETSIIRPGDELIILPVSGVLHRVKDGQTVSWIAKYYHAKTEEIIAFNNLPADGKVQIGQKLIIPNGQKPAPAHPKKTYQQRYIAARRPGNHFPYGQCTWYVAQKRNVPWSGHAKYWLGNAQAMGYATGRTPRVGAIIVTRESWYGHVGYVEAVRGNWVTFSEMNHVGWAIKSVRTLNVNDPRIRGYIY